MPTNGSIEKCYCGCEICEQIPTAIATLTVLSDEGSIQSMAFTCTTCLLNIASDPISAVPQEESLKGDLIIRLEARSIPGKPLFSDDPRMVNWAARHTVEVKALNRHANN